jgi:hypothetical protein
MSEVEIEIGKNGLGGKVVVDGHDLAGSVQGFTVHGQVGRNTRLELDLGVRDRTRFGSPHVQVDLDPTTVEYLERAGWTPPPGQPSALDRDEDGCPCEKKDVGWPRAKQKTILGRTVPTCPVHGVER